MNVADERSCCFRVTGAGGGAAEEEEEEDKAGPVVGAVVEHSCLRVTGGEGEEEEDEMWRPFTSSLTVPLALLGFVLLRTTSASLFTALLSSLGMILARYADDFLWTTVTWRRTSRLRRDS